MKHFNLAWCQIASAGKSWLVFFIIISSSALAEQSSNEFGNGILSAVQDCAAVIDGKLKLNDATLENQLKMHNLEYTKEMPADVSAFSFNPLWGKPTYFKKVTLDGDVLISTFENPNICRVGVFNSQNALDGRVKINSYLAADKYSIDNGRNSQRGLILFTFFVHPLGGGMKKIVDVSGPNVIVNEGRGLQLLVTVGRALN
jgi:hypothetical protein